MKLPEVVGCLHPRHAKSLDLRLSTLEPLNSGIMQIRVCKIGPVIFEYEYIRVYLSIMSECHLFMNAPGGDDVPSGTEAAIDDLFGVNRTRHPLSPTASEERPVVRRKRRTKWITRRVDSDEESAGRSSENNSDQDFIASDGASPESR